MCYDWGTTSEYRLEIGVFEGCGLVSAKLKGTSPPIIFTFLQWMPYNSVVQCLHKKLCCRLSSREVQFERITAFLSPRLQGFGATYAVKRVVDFLLVIISLVVTAERLRSKIDWKSALSKERGQFGPKFQVQGVVPHQSSPFFLWEN